MNISKVDLAKRRHIAVQQRQLLRPAIGHRYGVTQRKFAASSVLPVPM